MFHRVVLLRKRTIAIATFLLLAATAFMRWRATSGYMPWVMLGAGLVPLTMLIAYWVRARMNTYSFLEDTRAEVSRLFDIGSGKKAKMRALRVHIVAYEVYMRRGGSENLTVYPYWRHLDKCLQYNERPTMPLPYRLIINEQEPLLPRVIDAPYLENDERD